jgi:putative ABC transport system ATP-binding protein
MTSRPVIEICNLHRSHRQADGLFALHVPDLVLYPAQTTVFQGPSGCGKSTLFDTLGLIARPDSSERFLIHQRDETTTDVTCSRESALTSLRGSMIGYVLQHGGLIPSLTVCENILMPCRLAGYLPDKSRLESLVTRLGITDQLKKKPSKLSGGQQQRVAIARALIHRPAIVLADEPTGQLDSVIASDVRDLLISVAREESASLLVVTHDSSLFSGFADREFGFEINIRQRQVFSTLRETRNAAGERVS